jgi:hypothetical protein
MIDWTKPIETMEGREVTYFQGASAAILSARLVWVRSNKDTEHGDVFLVDDEGFRCDDRAIYSARQEPFIRNVKVKKEGWVLMRPSSASMDGRYLADDRVYASEAEAKSANANWYGADPGVKPVHLTWEE